MGVLTGLRVTLKINAALELPRNKATFWVDSVNVGFGSKYREEILNLLYLTGLEKFMTGAVQTNGGTFQRNSPLRTSGTRGAAVQELVKDDRWWYRPQFLKSREDERPERKFGKTPEAYKEVESEKREQFVEKDLSMNTQSYCVETVTPKSTPDPM